MRQILRESDSNMYAGLRVVFRSVFNPPFKVVPHPTKKYHSLIVNSNNNIIAIQDSLNKFNRIYVETKFKKILDEILAFRDMTYRDINFDLINWFKYELGDDDIYDLM